MFNKKNTVLICSGILLTSTAFAATNFSKQYQLNPNIKETIRNLSLTTSEMICTISGADAEGNNLVLTAGGDMDVNGKALKKGETINLLIHNNENIMLKNNVASHLEVVNQGQNTITANCAS